MSISDGIFLRGVRNLVPWVSPLDDPGSEKGETGHVSPKIWEITNKWLEGGEVECQFSHTKCTGDGKIVNQLEILEILAKSLQQSQNRLLVEADRGDFFGDAVPLCEFLPQ